MSEPRNDQDDKPETNTKRPYEAPCVIEEVVFETLALSCTGNNRVDCQGPFLSS